MKLDNLRKKIDAIDMHILDLLNKRAILAKIIGKLKSADGQNFYIPHREKMIIANLLKHNKGILPPTAIESIFREIINSCRSIEKNMKIAFLGPEATFTHQAALKNFGSGAEYISVKSIADVFTEVEKNRADYGVVPIENSSEGVVNHTLDTFMESDLHICAEINMAIEQCFLSLSPDKESVNKVYSHPHALAQCRNWLEENLPGVQIEETASTVEAAKKALKDKSSAAIASNAAAILYGLEVLERGIEDSRENFTRFLIIGKHPVENSGQDKTSILFSIKDKVGALQEMLQSFKENKINLTKIESRPTKKRAWEYIFFVDFMGHVSDKNVIKALKQLEKSCAYLKILGSYPKAE